MGGFGLVGGVLFLFVVFFCLAALLFLLALGLTLYPLIANRYNQRHQSKIHTAYQEQVAQADKTEIIAAREKAVAYNETLVSGVQAEDAFSNEALTGASENYGTLLNLTGNGIMGYIGNLHIAHDAVTGEVQKGPVVFGSSGKCFIAESILCLHSRH